MGVDPNRRACPQYFGGRGSTIRGSLNNFSVTTIAGKNSLLMCHMLFRIQTALFFIILNSLLLLLHFLKLLVLVRYSSLKKVTICSNFGSLQCCLVFSIYSAYSGAL